jgi:hypothetical protein
VVQNIVNIGAIRAWLRMRTYCDHAGAVALGTLAGDLKKLRPQPFALGDEFLAIHREIALDFHYDSNAGA